jgi:hypothetical protein
MTKREPARYQFTRIPNNEEGRELVRLMRKYLNKDRYTLRARGQGLKDGRDWRHFQYGAGLKDSSHIRVYIDDTTKDQPVGDHWKYRLGFADGVAEVREGIAEVIALAIE